MSKKKLLRNSPLYLLTAANIIYAVQHGFNWLTWFAIGLTLIVFVWDIVEVFKRGKKQKWDSTGIYEEKLCPFPVRLAPGGSGSFPGRVWKERNKADYRN